MKPKEALSFLTIESLCYSFYLNILLLLLLCYYYYRDLIPISFVCVF